MDAGDFYLVPRRGLAHGLARRSRNIRDRIGEGKRGNLYSGVAQPRGASQDVV